MDTAFYGYGIRGRRLLDMVREALLPGQEPPLIFDRKYEELRKSAPAGMDVRDPEELVRLYRAGRFSAVYITVKQEGLRREIASWLAREQIPVISFRELVIRLTGIRDAAQDPETLDLLEARIMYALYGRWDEILAVVERYRGDRVCTSWLLSRFMEKNKTDRIVLAGTPAENAINRRILVLCGLKAEGQADFTEGMATPALEAAAPSGGRSEGHAADPHPAHILRDLIDRCGRATVICTKSAAQGGVNRILDNLAVPEDCRFLPYGDGYISGMRKGQYFDVWEPGNECFIDCGAYNGDTVRTFLAWTKGRYQSILALEPMSEMLPVLERNIGGDPHIEIIPKAAWSGSGSISFVTEDNRAGSHIQGDFPTSSETGRREVGTAALDDLTTGPVTLIKMDIEGSEMEALRGAAGLIRTWKPRLAISIYHRPCDCIQIPQYLLELVPEYRFKVRHYGADIMETVLYASVTGFDKDESE